MNKLMTALCAEFESMEKTIGDQKEQIISLRNTIGTYSKLPCGCPAVGNAPVLDLPKWGLEATSWADIALVAAKGFAPSFFALGDTKTIHLTNGEDIVVRIVGFNHDQQSGGAFVPISFEMVNVLSEEMQMNEEYTNKGGWAHSYLRKFLNESIFALLPDDVKAVIKPVIKLTSKGSGSEELEATLDALWIASEQEHFGRKFWSVGGEGRWYDFYKQENAPYYKRSADGEDAAWPWLRSPGSGDTTHFCFVYSSGVASYYAAISSFGVSFGFCV